MVEDGNKFTIKYLSQKVVYIVVEEGKNMKLNI
jgi:hypothetical protein